MFILTPDLAIYLFKLKNDNTKYKNRLYVALTRSLNKLTIYVDSNVEKQYGKKFIKDFFKGYNLIEID